MLQINQLQGFSVPRIPDMKARYVGRYSYTFTAANVANFTIPAGDLQYNAAANRQLVIMTSETGFLYGRLTCGIVDAALLVAEYGVGDLLVAFGMRLPGSGPFTFQFTAGGVVASGTLVAEVWEIENGEDLTKCNRGASSLAASTTQSLNLARPDGSVAMALAASVTDTATFTWTNLTEQTDADAGDHAVSAALNMTPIGAGGGTTTLVTAVSSSGNSRVVGVSCQPMAQPGVKGGLVETAFLNPSGGTFVGGGTFRAENYGYGPYKAVIGVAYSGDVAVSGATIGGVAMNLIASGVNATPSPDRRIHFFEQDVIPDGSPKNWQINFAAGLTTNVQVCVWRQFDVRSILAYNATGNGTSLSVAINTELGGRTLAMAMCGGLASPTLLDRLRDSGGGFSIAEKVNTPQQVGRVIGFSGFAATDYAMAAVQLNP